MLPPPDPPCSLPPPPQAKRRIGLAEQSVLVALGQAVVLHQLVDGPEPQKEKGMLAERLEAAAQAVKHAFSECPSYEVVSTLPPSSPASAAL